MDNTLSFLTNGEIPETRRGLAILKDNVPPRPICFMHGLLPAMNKGEALPDGLTIANGDATAEYHSDTQSWVVTAGREKQTKAILDAIIQRLERIEATRGLPETIEPSGPAPVIDTVENVFS